jgi:hypothetical protein
VTGRDAKAHRGRDAGRGHDQSADAHHGG